MFPRRQPFLLNAPSRKDLELICDMLNSKTAAGARLRELVTAWEKSGPNLSKMMKEDSMLWLRLRKACRVKFNPTASGRADLQLDIVPLDFEANYYEEIKKHFHRRAPDEGQAAVQAERDSLRLFLLLILNPAWEKLGGPCSRCGSYYVKKRASQKVYCSRRCGNAATAILRTANQRAEERTNKLRAARKFLRQWRRSSGVKWNEFVSDKTGLTIKWLTRAANRGELRPAMNSQIHKQEKSSARKS